MQPVGRPGISLQNVVVTRHNRRRGQTHPSRDVELAIREAVDNGWTLQAPTAAFIWGTLLGPNGWSQIAVPTTPAAGQAREIRRAVQQQRRHYPEPKMESDPPDEPRTASDSESTAVISAFTRLSNQLLVALEEDPKLLYGLHWREFEELVAELLSREGLEVTLTPGSRDRGVDIYARHYGPMGATLYVVECKRYGPERPVGPDLVRTLYGVVERERATRGLLVTSSYFSVEAEREVRELTYRLALRDGQGVSEWLRTSRVPQ